jgi:hypothetical protein
MCLIKKVITTAIGLDLDSIWFIKGSIVFKILMPSLFWKSVNADRRGEYEKLILSQLFFILLR